MIPLDENALMQRIIAHDQSALTELYDHFSGPVFGMTLRVLQNQTLAEEALQDTFMKVWRGALQWDPQRGRLLTWLLTVARYTAIDRLREEKRQSPWTSIGMDDFLARSSDPNLVDGGPLDPDDLAQLLQKLPHEQVEAIELAFFRGMSHSEVAEAVKQPLGTVKSRIRDGLKRLRGLWLQQAEQ